MLIELTVFFSLAMAETLACFYARQLTDKGPRVVALWAFSIFCIVTIYIFGKNKYIFLNQTFKSFLPGGRYLRWTRWTPITHQREWN